jgi:hypothetical protein
MHYFLVISGTLIWSRFGLVIPGLHIWDIHLFFLHLLTSVMWLFRVCYILSPWHRA